MDCMVCKLYLNKAVIFLKSPQYNLALFSVSAHPLVGFYLETCVPFGTSHASPKVKAIYRVWQK